MLDNIQTVLHRKVEDFVQPGVKVCSPSIARGSDDGIDKEREACSSGNFLATDILQGFGMLKFFIILLKKFFSCDLHCQRTVHAGLSWALFPSVNHLFHNVDLLEACAASVLAKLRVIVLASNAETCKSSCFQNKWGQGHNLMKLAASWNALYICLLTASLYLVWANKEEITL